jgi:hypothetical protein
MSLPHEKNHSSNHFFYQEELELLQNITIKIKIINESYIEAILFFDELTNLRKHGFTIEILSITDVATALKVPNDFCMYRIDEAMNFLIDAENFYGDKGL